MSYPTVHLTQQLGPKLRRGHPWIYADAVRHKGRGLSAGDVVEVVDASGDFVGRGIIDPDSPVRVRMWTTRDDVSVDDELLKQRIKDARRRRALPDGMTTGFRLLNGEGDRTPGLVCDIYGDVAVLRPDGIAAEQRWLKPARDIIASMFSIKHWVIRRSAIHADAKRPVAQWWGAAPESGDVVEFLEHGLRYECDVISGQKTGFFLDMRANRERVGRLAAGKRVLNLFGYTGGFSLASAAQGAAGTTTVDLAAPAVEQARRHFELNGLWHPGHEFVVSDVFAYLEQFGPQGAPFEVAVCDPPSFAHKRRDLKRAQAAYVRLFGTLMKVMRSGSVLVLGSCSSHIDRDMFLDLVGQAAMEAECQLVMTGVYGADHDHPFLPVFSEGDYLQCVMATLHRD
jgi:23S rRNA (cytosine1962-C5)-methyltransferase